MSAPYSLAALPGDDTPGAGLATPQTPSERVRRRGFIAFMLGLACCLARPAHADDDDDDECATSPCPDETLGDYYRRNHDQVVREMNELSLDDQDSDGQHTKRKHR